MTRLLGQHIRFTQEEGEDCREKLVCKQRWKSNHEGLTLVCCAPCFLTWSTHAEELPSAWALWWLLNGFKQGAALSALVFRKQRPIHQGLVQLDAGNQLPSQKFYFPHFASRKSCVWVLAACRPCSNVTLHSLSFSVRKLEVKESKFPGDYKTTQWKEPGSLNHYMAVDHKTPNWIILLLCEVPDMWDGYLLQHLGIP